MAEAYKFITGLVAGFLVMCGITFGAFYLNLGVHTKTSKWVGDIIEKKSLLAQSRPSPKLLIVGGSSALYGISAKEIEDETGISTVNLGSYAPLGTEYMLYKARQVAAPGDYVLLAFEYHLYAYGKINRTWADSFFLDYLVAEDPDFFHSLSASEQWNVFMLTSRGRLTQGLKARFRDGREISNQGPTVVTNVNNWGDFTGHAVANRKGTVAQQEITDFWAVPDHPAAFELLQEFCNWAKLHQVRVFATFPNMCGRTTPQSRIPGSVRSFFAHFDVPVIGDFQESLLPAETFFDTFYHPTQEASIERTRRLAAQLRPYLK